MDLRFVSTVCLTLLKRKDFSILEIQSGIRGAGPPVTHFHPLLGFHAPAPTAGHLTVGVYNELLSLLWAL